MRRGRTILLLAAVLAAAGLWYWFRGSDTPPGQAALHRLTADNFSDLPAAFNGAAGAPRLVILLSPT